MIELQDVNKIYKTQSGNFYGLKNISIKINPGEMVAICGTSGAGKTTLLNILGLVDRFDSGTYLLDGVSVGELKDKKMSEYRNKKIGFVFQDFALLNDQKVLYNVLLPLLYNKKYSYRQAIQKAENVLTIMGIDSQKNKLVNQLSGGQKQRVAIARAIVNDPAVILADEPTGALDNTTTQQVLECLTNINKIGTTVIVVTHDKEVASFCSRTITIDDGEIR